MTGNAKAIPDGYHTLTPQLIVRGAMQAIEFYQRAFGATLISASPDGPGGKITHATLKMGDSILMLSDEFPEWKCLGPESIGGTPVTIHVYVENVDEVFQRAVNEGASVAMPLQDQFWGDRYGQVVDPFGHRWSLATHVENLTREEIAQRSVAIFGDVWKKAVSAS
jgi:PhnB protein